MSGLDASLLAYKDPLILLARALVSALFLLTGWQKMTGFAGTIGYMQSVGAPLPTVAAAVSVVMEFFVGAALLLGIWVRPLALLLFLFTFGTALIGHHFWTLQGPDRHVNQLNFFKNLSIMGGLLLLAITGAGGYALT
jgi:putative oxidoreductase